MSIRNFDPQTCTLSDGRVMHAGVWRSLGRMRRVVIIFGGSYMSAMALQSSCMPDALDWILMQDVTVVVFPGSNYGGTTAYNKISHQNVDQLCEDVQAVLMRLDLAHAVECVIGLSAGAQWAIPVAQKFNARAVVQPMLPINDETWPYFREGSSTSRRQLVCLALRYPRLFRWVASVQDWTARQTPESVVKALGPDLYPDPVVRRQKLEVDVLHRKSLAQEIDLAARGPDSGFLREFQNLVEWDWSQMFSFQGLVHVVWGAQDQVLTGKMAEVWTRTPLRVRVHRIENAGHYLWLDCTASRKLLSIALHSEPR